MIKVTYFSACLKILYRVVCITEQQIFFFLLLLFFTFTFCFTFFFSPNRQLLTLPLSLSEEELLKMKQEFHCCFSQLDSSLALPKIRARALLQAFELEWRDAQLLKVNQNLAMINKQVGTFGISLGMGEVFM